jgi:vacuolar-type H+-ATPase subunit H
MQRRGSWFLREFLDRFRRSAGVPAQVADDLAAELAPLFAVLDAIDRDAAVMRDDAARHAAELRESAAAEADRRLATGHAEAEHERLRVMAEARGAAEAEADAIRSSGTAEAGRIRVQAQGKISVLAARVVRCVVEGEA